MVHEEHRATKTKKNPEIFQGRNSIHKKENLQIKDAAIVSDPDAKQNRNTLAGQEHCKNSANLTFGLSSFIYGELEIYWCVAQTKTLSETP